MGAAAAEAISKHAAHAVASATLPVNTAHQICEH